MDREPTGTTTEEVVTAVLDSAPDALTVVNPSLALLEAVVEEVSDRQHRPEVRLLGERSTLKTATEGFVLASAAADLVESGDLSVRTADLPRTSLLLTPSQVISVVAAGDDSYGLPVEKDQFVDTVRDAYRETWASAEPFEFRTPGFSRIQESLEEAAGAEVRADFEAMVEAAETEAVDAVVVSLLAAARNEVLLYDISRWGEDVGLASKATFSRTKSRLEEADVIDTERVPIDVGRPRLRLKLADDRVKDAERRELAGAAERALGA